MGDVPMLPEPEPSATERTVEEVGALYRRALTGDPHGRVRRKTLFLIAEIGIVIAIALGGAVGLIAGVVGLIAVLLLAMTDDVVDLS